MLRRIELRCPDSLVPHLATVLQSLAVLFQSEFDVKPLQRSSVATLSAGGPSRVELPIPDLDDWMTGAIEITVWRGIPLPHRGPIAGAYPDLLGLTYFVFMDIEERRQEAANGEGKFDVRRSVFAPVLQVNYLDLIVEQIRRDLGIQEPRFGAIILTHDLDLIDHRAYPRTATCSPSLREIAGHLRAFRLRSALLRLRDSARSLVAFIQQGTEKFEFAAWAGAEAERGFRSVFFVFAPERLRTFPQDAWYAFTTRNRSAPWLTLRAVLARLLRQGFEVAPHFSRSADYRLDLLCAECHSIRSSLNVKLESVRNHWVWIRYSDWPEYLKVLDLRYDFNTVAIGYRKGTTYPYLLRNGGTWAVSTTFADDLAFKASNGFSMTPEAGLACIERQLRDVERFGGCIALSFHPAEDGPPGTLSIPAKLPFYREVLRLLSDRGLSVLLPREALERLWTGARVTYGHSAARGAFSREPSPLE